MLTAADPGLLWAVLERPEDDAPRLAYADSLDERAGEHTPLAAFIRVQCELARLESEMESVKGHPDGPSYDRYRKATIVPHLALRERERELWDAWAVPQIERAMHDRTPWGDLPGRAVGYWLYGVTTKAPDEEVRYVFRRGFVDEVALPCGLFVGRPCERCEGIGECSEEDFDGRTYHRAECSACSGSGRTNALAPRLFAAQPVTRVVLADREPEVVPPHPVRRQPPLRGVDDVGEPGEAYFRCWRREEIEADSPHHDLPPELFEPLVELGKVYPDDPHLVFFPTRAAALDALGFAAVAYGRAHAAGLTHRGGCSRCKRKGFIRTRVSDDGVGRSTETRECPDCAGRGFLDLPGLPPPARSAPDA